MRRCRGFPELQAGGRGRGRREPWMENAPVHGIVEYGWEIDILIFKLRTTD